MKLTNMIYEEENDIEFIVDRLAKTDGGFWRKLQKGKQAKLSKASKTIDVMKLKMSPRELVDLFYDSTYAPGMQFAQFLKLVRNGRIKLDQVKKLHIPTK